MKGLQKNALAFPFEQSAQAHFFNDYAGLYIRAICSHSSLYLSNQHWTQTRTIVFEQLETRNLMNQIFEG